MELLSPARITSLEGKAIRVILHLDKRRTEELSLPTVYPFETLYTLKQRITLLKSGDKNFLPNYLFIAQDVGGGNYTSLEFYWPFNKALKDPFATPGVPDERIYEDGEIKGDVFPYILSGITMEDAMPISKMSDGARVIHVWTADSLLKAAGFGPRTMITDEAFHGFFALYFPYFKTAEDLMATFAKEDAEDKLVLATAQTYRKEVDARLAKIEAGLGSISVAKAPAMRLRELRYLRYELPTLESIEKGVLELKFYELNPSSTIPFIRFFSRRDATLPLIKVATTTTGTPIIKDPKVLDLYMADTPDTEKSAVLMLKAPINHSQAPQGTCWTLNIFESGLAHLKIGAPRKDAPLTQVVIEAAIAALPDFLEQTPWAEVKERTLVDITAVYDFKSPLTEKPNRAELRGRLDAFVSFFSEEPLPPKTKAAMMLRYRAVSNYDYSNNPIMNYITNIFLRDTKASSEEIPDEAYVASLVSAFGLPPPEAEKALNKWIESQFEYVLQNKETALQAANLGAAVGLTTNNHPYYTFYLANVQSLKALQRVLSLLSVFSSLPSSALRVGPIARAEAAIKKAAAASPESSPESLESAGSDDSEGVPVPMFGMQQFDGFDDDEADPFAVAAVPKDPSPESLPDSPESGAGPRLEVKEVEAPKRLREDERIEPIKSGWFLDNLKRADPGLFGGLGGKARGDTYSVKCQKTGFRQPFVLTLENYFRARKLYRSVKEGEAETTDDVFWVEAPLEMEQLQAVTLATKAETQRVSHASRDLKLKVDKKDVTKIVDLEIMALELGFGLKGDASVSGAKLDASAKELKEYKKDRRFEVYQLMQAQKKKPLWTVTRAGSDDDRPNYYWCGLYWCVRDELPLIPEEFRGDKLRNGDPKEPDSCPFCGGTLVKDLKDPEVGETVYERQKTGKGVSRVAQYVGMLKEVSQPDGYALPCCFVDPDSLSPPAVAKPMPKYIPLSPESAASNESEESTISTVSTESASEEERDGFVALPDDENRVRPFAPFKLRVDAEKEKARAMNQWYIPNQNVIGRSAAEWYNLGFGEVGVPAPSVNRLLGQDPNAFLTANKGVLGQGINSYLRVPATGFIRFGLGNTGLLGLISYASYVVKALDEDPTDVKLVIKGPKEIFEKIFGSEETGWISEKTGDYARAFAQANYGTLLHEFVDQSIDVTDGELSTWCRKIGQTFSSEQGQRYYLQNFYKAWAKFREYVASPDQKKELRLFEGLFATPGLFTRRGFILVRIVVPKNPAEPARIVCPEFGASEAAQLTKPPLIFVIEDEATGLYDPLVLYSGFVEEKKEIKHLFGAISEKGKGKHFADLAAEVQKPLTAFITQFYGPFNGCARSAPIIHPWLGSRIGTGIPTLTDLVKAAEKRRKKKKEEAADEGEKVSIFPAKLHALLRDRSNRLVGVIASASSKHKHGEAEEAYLPVIDDGTVYPQFSIRWGEEALPKPDSAILLDLLIGQQYPAAEKKLSGSYFFKAYTPVKVIKADANYVAFELECGAIIPFKPTTKIVSNKEFGKAMKEIKGFIDPRKDMPWDRDIALIGPTKSKEASGTIEPTDEELLEESYQHLRISFSHWLHTDPAGVKTRKQIELLRRKAHSRVIRTGDEGGHGIPLWELRKRMDVLLSAAVLNEKRPWLTTEGSPVKTFLRRDCLQIKESEECTGGCAWAGEPARCMIHTTGTERYVDPVAVLVKRLTDELIRTFGAAQEVLHQKVPYLKPIAKEDLIRGENSVMFSAEGRGGEPLLKRLGYYDRQPTEFTRGLTYPEEVDVEVAEQPPLPASWKDKFTFPDLSDLGADAARDPQKRFEFAIEHLSGQSVADILEKMDGEPLDGTDSSLNRLARILNVNFIQTAFEKTGVDDEGKPTGRLIQDEWYGEEKPYEGIDEPMFVVLDHDGVPLLYTIDGPFKHMFKMPKSKLPKVLRKWLRNTPAVSP